MEDKKHQNGEDWVLDWVHGLVPAEELEGLIIFSISGEGFDD